MNHKQLLKGFLTLAILICTQVNAWALNNNLPRRAGRCHFAVEPGVDGNGSDAGTASGDDHAGAQLRDDARGDV